MHFIDKWRKKWRFLTCGRVDCPFLHVAHACCQRKKGPKKSQKERKKEPNRAKKSPKKKTAHVIGCACPKPVLAKPSPFGFTRWSIMKRLKHIFYRVPARSPRLRSAIWIEGGAVTCEKRSLFFECFAYVRPEPVLVK
jgi:hypothetical protein